MIVSPAGFLLVSAVPFRRLDLDFIQDQADPMRIWRIHRWRTDTIIYEY